MNINNFEFKFLTSIEQIGLTAWNSIVESDYPFIQYDFLHALESSGCVCVESGWQPHHLAVYDQNEIIAVMPLYIKTHSYGEYVFDFQWANAYHQNGLNYYPKLLNAIPFTPCSGTRLIIKNSHLLLKEQVIQMVINQAKKIDCSSFHSLFPASDSTPPLNINTESMLMKRLGTQYQWSNQSYASFDDFLAACTMKRRKSIKRERRIVQESGIKLLTIEGDSLTNEHWQSFYDFYLSTYAKRSGNDGYLNLEFFQQVGQNMAEKIMMIVAVDSASNNKIIAMSLFFKDENTLYGRYWGCAIEVEFLHFEACYYQGIEYCIENGLQLFDAGAQGEHKIPRGFEPIVTYSYHWINDQRFELAIKDFLEQESLHVQVMIKELNKKLPYKTS